MKKVLIITYYWPPAGGPGVQRWLKFVKYLRDFGVEPVVYVPKNPSYPIIDRSFEKEIPAGIEVIKKRIFEPYSLAKIFSKGETETISSGIIADEEKQSFLQKLMLFIRGNFFIPDARKFWIRPSVRFLKGYLKENNIDTIITTGPPHSLHLIGLQLKEQMGTRWLADFRDPWTQIGYHEKLKLTSASRKKHEALEKEVLQKADEIITTSFTTRAEFEGKTKRPVTVITNGFEKAAVEEIKLDEKFSISHIGSLLSGRDPGTLWRILAELVHDNKDFATDLELNVAGAVSEEVVQSIKKAGLGKNLILKGYVSHDEALELQKKSQLLLLIEIDSEETRGIIAGKLYEYMAAKRPILAIGPESWDVERIISETGTGKVFSYRAGQELKEYLMQAYKEYKAGNLKSKATNIEQYSRRNLTGKLAKLITAS
ncbi:MAG: glycosyl transferase family 1 [Salegentibacter sp.]